MNNTLGISIGTFTHKVREIIEDAKTVKSPSLDVPYLTNDIINGHPVWCVRLDCGSLPKNCKKLITLPECITSCWGAIGERWIDTSMSYAYNEKEGKTISIPYTDIYPMMSRRSNSVSDIDQTQISLCNTDIEITTMRDLTDYKAIVAVKFLKKAEASEVDHVC